MAADPLNTPNLTSPASECSHHLLPVPDQILYALRPLTFTSFRPLTTLGSQLPHHFLGQASLASGTHYPEHCVLLLATPKQVSLKFYCFHNQKISLPHGSLSTVQHRAIKQKFCGQWSSQEVHQAGNSRPSWRRQTPVSQPWTLELHRLRHRPPHSRGSHTFPGHPSRCHPVLPQLSASSGHATCAQVLKSPPAQSPLYTMHWLLQRALDHRPPHTPVESRGPESRALFHSRPAFKLRHVVFSEVPALRDVRTVAKSKGLVNPSGS